jgi:hypothetical protein
LKDRQDKDHPEKITRKRSPGPAPFNLTVVMAVLIQGQLNGRLQPAVVVVVESDKLEWLELL